MKLLTLSTLVFILSYIHVDERPKFDRSPAVAQHNLKNENATESEVAFHRMMDVLTHQRCVNCHPAGDSPLQGEDQHTHYYGVTRGINNKGTEVLQCQSCHQPKNNSISGAPGADEWSLAPRSMAWEGKNRFEIAAAMMNRETNGNRSPEDIMHHLTEHELVLWAWEPGTDADGIPRQAPPVDKNQYIAAVKTWIAAGAIIPNKD